METILSFWWDLEKYRQKSVPSPTFLRCGDYLKFLRRVGKFRQKRCDQLHIFFAVQTISSFWWDLEKFSQKKCPVTRFVLCGDYLKFWMGLRKVSTKKCAQLHVLFAVETISSFGWHLENFPQIYVPSYTFFRSADYLKFLMGLGKLFTKKCPVTRFVLCGDYLKNFHKKCAQLHICSLWRLKFLDWDLKFLRRVGKFRQKGVPSYTFFRSADYLKFLMGLGKIFTKKVPNYTFCSLWRLSQKFSQKSVPSYTFCSLWRLS